MRILIIASYNSNRFSPFVIEQVESLKYLGVEFEYFGVVGKSVLGYLKNWARLIRKIKAYKPNIIHAHYGLSGLLANLQRKIPVITTYHGSDIHSSRKILFMSKITMRWSAYNIFVGQSLFDIAKYKGKNYIIQSCGLDLSIIKPVSSAIAKAQLGIDQEKSYILFGGSFDKQVKNYPLAKQSVESAGNCHLIELKGYTKEQVALLMNACHLLLVTSFRESGPLVIKEAMACNCPIVTTDVGDVKWVIGNTEGCYITSYDIDDCVENIKKAIQFSIETGKTNGRKRIIEIGLDNEKVAKKILRVYEQVLSKSKNK